MCEYATYLEISDTKILPLWIGRGCQVIWGKGSCMNSVHPEQQTRYVVPLLGCVLEHSQEAPKSQVP